MADPTPTARLTIVPADEGLWADLQAVLGTRGDSYRCQCQRYKMQPRESWASVGADERAFRLRAQTDCGGPDAGATSGPIACLGGEPVGWCAVEPRTPYPPLLSKTGVFWARPRDQPCARARTLRRVVMRIDF
jgi:hypothetical protein